MSTNLFINEFIEDKQNASKNNLSFTKNNCIRISENIIDINPVPIFVKTQINDYTEINNEFHILAENIPEEQLYIHKNQDPNTKSGIFTSQNAYVPYNNILNDDNMYIELLKSHIIKGISELVSTLYNYNGDYKYTILNSWIQKYKNGTFLSPHNHLSSNKSNNKVFSVAYYIDDGDPDTSQSYSGCISFMSNNNLIHFRPKSGTLLIWEDNLIHLVNPFYSNSDKERFMLSTNISVEF
jgi:hypothetical protein